MTKPGSTPASSHSSPPVPSAPPGSGDGRNGSVKWLGSGWFLVVALLLLAFNLRTAVTSLGAVLSEVSADLRLAPAYAGVLTTLPVLCFAGFGAAAPGLARRFGTRHVIAASLAGVVTGTIVRALGDSALLFTAATVLALAGMATGNVLLPAIVKARFPDRIGAATAAYTTMLAVGTTLPAGATVPITEAAGSWRYGLAIWAGTAAIALLPWLLLAFSRHGRHAEATGPGATRSEPTEPDPTRPDTRPHAPDKTTPGKTTPDMTGQAAGARRRIGVRDLARSRIAWALALYFGLQSGHAYVAFGWLAQVYRDAGLPAAQAGLLLSVLPVAGVPVALALPAIAARFPDQRPAVAFCGLAFASGYVGLLLAPATVPLLWVLLLGLGGGAFPLALTMIGLRSRSSEVTVGLSGFVQGVGYLVAAASPLSIGALYGVSGDWTVPLCVLLALVLPQVAAGMLAGRKGHVDDQL